jgi:hypothetical protein
VQTVQGSNIGLAIPASELVSVFHGTLGTASVAVKPGTNGAAAKYDLVLPRVDPTNQLRSAEVHLVSKMVPANPAKAGQPQLLSEASSRKIDLTLNGNDARAELPAGVAGGQQITVQVSYVNGQGVTIYLEPQVITVPAPAQTAQTPGGVTSTIIIGPDGTTTTTTTQNGANGDGGTSRRQVTVTRRSSSGKQASAPRDGKKSAFKTGDNVRVAWGGKIQDAEVIHVDANDGWVMVKFWINGLEMTPSLPPDQVEMGDKASRKQASKSSGGKNSTVKTGDKVRVAWAGKIEDAEVVNVGSNGWVTVKFWRNGIEMTPTLPPDDIEVAAKKSSVKPEAKLRTWSSKGGKFKMKARFVELKDDAVALEKEGGDTVTVAMDKLSDDDQKVARQLAEELEDDPFGSDE